MLDQATLDKARQDRDKNDQDERGKKNHEDKLRLGVQSQMTNLTGFVKLIEFLDGHTTKTEITNHLKSISTPDVKEVVSELVEVKKEIIKKNIDISPLQKCLEQIETQLSTLPRVFPEHEKVEEVKVSNLEKVDTQSIVDAINSLELNVESPQVNVDAPEVNVQAPDLDPIKLGLQNVVQAVLGIKWPEIPQIDLKGVEKRLDTSNEHLKKLVEKPVGGGGGGGTGTSFKDTTGKLTYVETESDGSIPVTVVAGGSATPNYATKIDTTTTTDNIYIGKAAIGSSGASAVWQIKKLDISTIALDKTWADGDDSFNNVWNNRASLTYS